MWIRHRFVQPTKDYRPLTFPPPGPYWCTGYQDGGSAIIVAFLPDGVSVIRPDLWPEAIDIESEERPEGPKFSDRFPKPEWWQGQEWTVSDECKAWSEAVYRHADQATITRITKHVDATANRPVID